MREIKFRGKSIATGEWVYGSLVKESDGKSWSISDGYASVDSAHLVDPETVGQFINMMDKNDKEIFEGDIVKNPNGVLRKVTFIRGRFAGTGDAPDPDNLSPKWEETEVISNHIDNPELIKEHKKR